MGISAADAKAAISAYQDKLERAKGNVAGNTAEMDFENCDGQEKMQTYSKEIQDALTELIGALSDLQFQ